MYISPVAQLQGFQSGIQPTLFLVQDAAKQKKGCLGFFLCQFGILDDQGCKGLLAMRLSVLLLVFCNISVRRTDRCKGTDLLPLQPPPDKLIKACLVFTWTISISSSAVAGSSSCERMPRRYPAGSRIARTTPTCIPTAHGEKNEQRFSMYSIYPGASSCSSTPVAQAYEKLHRAGFPIASSLLRSWRSHVSRKTLPGRMQRIL